MSADRRWYALGRFQVMAKPLDLNPYWTTHHIYLKGECIGRQLSVPSEADCEFYESRMLVIHAQRCTTITYSIHRKAGPGRPTRDRNYRQWIAEVTSD